MTEACGWAVGLVSWAKRALWSVTFLLAVVLAVLQPAGQALAEPAACQDAGNGAYTCSGDQSGGIVVGTNSGVPDDAVSVEVGDLTPLSGGAAYSQSFLRSGAENGGTTFIFDLDLGSIPFSTDLESGAVQVSSTGKDDGNHGRALSVKFSGAAKGIHPRVLGLSSEGKEGGNGKNEGSVAFKNGGDGGSGGAGGDLELGLNQAQATSTIATDHDLFAIGLLSVGAAGGSGGNGVTLGYDGGYGGGGGDGGQIVVENGGTLISVTGMVSLSSEGGAGGAGGEGANRGRSGGAGGAGGQLILDAAGSQASKADWSVDVRGSNVQGFTLQSTGGSGGRSGGSGSATGDPGGAGGAGGAIAANAGQLRTIVISGSGSTAFLAKSEGGGGGDGGGQTGAGIAGDGGAGGDGGGSVLANGHWAITGSEGAAGISLQNLGGKGGEAGGATVSSGGVGGAGGTAGSISLLPDGDSSVVTSATAIVLWAQGGDGGAGGGGASYGGTGSAGGGGGALTFDSDSSGAASQGAWTLETSDSGATALDLLSAGGAGAAGGGGATDKSGNGGSGGKGGTIAIGSGQRTITTFSADAVLARSLGGAGGHGGNSAGVADGGDGGSGGAGEGVALAGVWTIFAGGESSRGLVARSAGGSGGSGGSSVARTGGSGSGSGGGSGGAAGAVSLVTDETTRIMSPGTAIALVSLGGSGGGGGDGLNHGGSAGGGGAASSVSFGQTEDGSLVSGDWLIETTGEAAFGLNMVSEGGAGGTGGSGTTFDSGKGGSGGSGGEIATADLPVSITTSGSGAHAVIAASSGGSGGTGGANASIGTGGGGGVGGDAGDLELAGIWSLSAEGSGANGLMASSTGGSGGGGGNNSTSTTGGTGSGGVAGAGGSGGDISIVSGGPNQIASAGSGILAASTGGDGGRGGDGDTFGGTGGSGGDAGTVWFNEVAGEETWEIFTSGDGGLGISLTSQGGMGNLGGFSTSRTSGAGGSGGAASTVGIRSPGSALAVRTSGMQAHALVLSGLGGAGGDGRTAELGGDGADGGVGGEAGSIELSGLFNLTTLGSGSSGIVAASMGGSGGAGGEGNSVAGQGGVGGAGNLISLSFLDGSAITSTGSGISATSQGGRGGDGGEIAISSNATPPGATGGLGGQVTLTGGGDTALLRVSTTDDNAAGLSLASIGGEAGAGGAADGKTAGTGGTGGGSGKVTLGSIALEIATAGASAAGFHALSQAGAGNHGGDQYDNTQTPGTGGDGGAAGDLEIAAVWDVSTSGEGATGLLLQTIGGRAGSGGEGGGSDAASGTGGDAGAIALTLLAGSRGVATEGEGATAILASSLGGAASSTSGSAVGAGGAVTLDLREGMLSTLGSGSHGLAAESLAGGQLGSDVTGKAAGGRVAIAIGRGVTIRTAGDEAYGLLARSSGAGNTTETGGAKVVIQHAGRIEAPGAGSSGIYAESTGSGAGAVEIEIVEQGKVSGGAGAADSSGLDGAAVAVVGGTQENSLVNLGDTQAGQSGIAVFYSGSGLLSIANAGTIAGSVVTEGASLPANAASAGGVRLLNRQGGLLNAGERLDAQRVTNAGRLAPGGDGLAQTTLLTGDFIQRDSGVLAVDLDTSSGEADRLTVGGSAAVDGRIEVSLTDPSQPLAGAGSVTLLSAAGGLDLADGLAVTPSAVAQYAARETRAGALRLDYDIDFANAGLTAALNDNQDRVAAYLQDLYEAGGLEGGLAQELIGIEDAEGYAAVLQEFGAEVVLDNQLTSVVSSQIFNEHLLSCATTAGGDGLARFFDEGQCGYLGFGGRGFNRDATSDNLGFSGSSWTFTGGGQVSLSEDWSLGAAVSYERRRVNVTDSAASSKGNQVFFGLSVKRRFGDTELAATHSFGYGAFDIERTPLAGAEVSGDQGLWSTSGRIQAAHVLGWQDVYVMPRLAFGYDHYFSSSFTESGGSGLALAVETESQTYWSVEPAVEIGGEFMAAESLRVRPRLGLGVTQYLNRPSSSLQAEFAGGSGAATPFGASTAYDRTWGEIEAGLDVFTGVGATVRAGSYALLSANSTFYGGTLKVEVPF